MNIKKVQIRENVSQRLIISEIPDNYSQDDLVNIDRALDEHYPSGAKFICNLQDDENSYIGTIFYNKEIGASYGKVEMFTYKVDVSIQITTKSDPLSEDILNELLKEVIRAMDDFEQVDLIDGDGYMLCMATIANDATNRIKCYLTNRE